MRLLYLAQRVPFPPDRGDKIITFHEVEHFSRDHEVTVACLAQDESDLHHAQSLRSIAHRVHAVPLSSTGARIRAARSLAFGHPFTLGYFNEPALRRKVASLIASNSVDAAFVFCSGMAQYVQEFIHLPRIMHFADIDSQKWREYSLRTIFPKRWMFAVEARRLLDYERYVCETFDHSFVCTTNELEDFRRLASVSKVTYLANGVDVGYFKPAHVKSVSNSMVFTGVMDYPPNVDGCIWFCQEILPRIRKRIPNATFTICGARPNRQVRQLGILEGVTVTGHVPDVRPFLSSASVAVVPLRICRGIQNKVLEAMAMGLPVVTTSAAFCGVGATAGRDLVVADDEERFEACTTSLLRNAEQRRRMGCAARRFIQENYSWDRHASTLDETLDTVMKRRSRAKRFLVPGAALAVLDRVG